MFHLSNSFSLALIPLFLIILCYIGTSAGNELCEALLKAYDGFLPRSTGPCLAMEKSAVFSALKVLLAISDTAKSQALAGKCNTFYM